VVFAVSAHSSVVLPCAVVGNETLVSACDSAEKDRQMFNSRIQRQYFLQIVSALLLAVAAISQSVHSLQTVQTGAGKISGVRAATSGVMAFKGIPYAAPPTGELRWRPFNASANETMELGEKTGMRLIADSAKVRFFTDHFALPASRRSLF
jgi:hypothetical protein